MVKNKKNKRKSEKKDNEETEVPEKLIKLEEDTGDQEDDKSFRFDIKHFRKELTTAKDKTSILTQFLHVCTKSTSEDYISKYLDSGGTPGEILKQLDDQNHKNSILVSTVINLFNLILQKIQSSLPYLIQSAEDTCRYFLNSYVATIESMLSEKSNSKQQKLILKLLTTMITMNCELGITVLSQISLQPRAITHLAKHELGKEKDSVRSAFVYFLMSFLIDNNGPSIKGLLDKQGLLTTIFPNLVKDNAELILIVIELLKKSILNNTNVSKTTKIRTFNHNVISHFFNLFNWKDSSEKITATHKEDIDSNVNEFLEILCTSHKYGIYFTDKLLGTGETVINQHLWKAFELLEAPWNNEGVHNLLIQIIKVCPDLFKPIRQLIEASFDQNFDKLVTSLIFYKNILSVLPASNMINSMSEMDINQIMAFIKIVYLPPSILKVCIEKINSGSPKLQNEIIILLHTILVIIKSYLNVFETSTAHNKMRNSLLSRFEEFIPKHFPSTDLFIMKIHNILDKISHKKDDESDETFNESKCIINILNLLLIYDEIIPNSLDPLSTMLDSKRLFDKIETIQENTTDLKLKTTMLLFRADKFAFTPEKPLFQEVLLAMLDVYVSNNELTFNEVKSVLYNILLATGIFEQNCGEIDLLLCVIRHVSRTQEAASISRMIFNIVNNMILNREKYEMLHMNYCSANNESDKKNLNFDEIFDNVENYNRKESDMNFVQELSSLTFFITGLLKIVKKIGKSFDIAHNFVDRYVINLVHIQNDFNAICNILEQMNTSQNIEEYIFGWKTSPTSFSKIVFDKQEIAFKLSRALIKDEIFDPSIMLNDDQLVRDASELYVLCNMLLFYTIRQNSLGELNEIKLKNIINTTNYLVEKCFNLNEYNKKDFIRVVGKLLGNSILQEDFNPFEKEKHDTSYLTRFVLSIIDHCNKKSMEIKTLKIILKPIKHKMYLLLKNDIQNNMEHKKGVKYTNLDYVFSILKLDLADANLLLDEILNLDVSCFATNADEPSSWIQILRIILYQNIENSFLLSIDTFNKILHLYSNIIKELDFAINIIDLEEGIYNYLLNNPNLMVHMSAEIFEDIFSIKYVSKYTSKLTALMVQTNPNLLSKFNKIIIRDEILSKREFVIPVTLAAMNHAKFKYSVDIAQTIFEHYKPNIIKLMEKPQKVTQIYIDNIRLVVNLINNHMKADECKLFFSKVHKFDTTDVFHIEVLDAVFFKCALEDYSRFENFLLTIFHLTIVTLKREECRNEKLSRISTLLRKIIQLLNDEHDAYVKEGNFNNIIKNAIWQNFVKQILLFYLKPEECNNTCMSLFEDFSNLIKLLYHDDHSDIEELFNMATSHSEFLNIMLNNHGTLIKEHLVRLIYTMLQKNKETMKPTQISLFLSAYYATTSKCDQTLLKIIKLYEHRGHSLAECRPYLWGDAGAHHFSLRSSRKKTSLWSNPTVNHVLNLLGKDRIEATINNFPIHLKLNFENNVNNMKYDQSSIINDIIDEMMSVDFKGFDKIKKNLTNSTSDSLSFRLKLNKYERCLQSLDSEIVYTKITNKNDMYDPTFLLPLLNYIVSPGSLVSCHRIIRGGILAIPVMALSSYCPMMRAAAYNILYRFYSQLESEMFYKNDKLLWTQFLNTLKSSLGTAICECDESQGIKNPRLPILCALYLAKAALIMTSPLDPLFKPINNFILAKQFIDFTIIPDFLELFHSSDLTSIERRIWILETIKDGVHTFSDVKLLLKSVIFKMLFDFYNCCLANSKVKFLILEIVNRVICIPKAAKILSENYGLFPWLSTLCANIHNENKDAISLILLMIHNLLVTLMIDSTIKVTSGNKNDVMGALLNGKCFRLNETVQLNILCPLMDLLNKISVIKIDDLKVYLKTLHKISNVTIKSITKVQMLKLIKECDTVCKIHKKHTKSLIMAVESNKITLMMPSKILISQKDTLLNDEDIIIKYLYETVSNWLS